MEEEEEEEPTFFFFFFSLFNFQIKWWIGNAAEDGKAATVFARLKVPAPDGSGSLDDHGVHAFIVPLRDAEHKLMPGVEIHDCGYKVCTCILYGSIDGLNPFNTHTISISITVN